jgi:Zn-dependent protease
VCIGVVILLTLSQTQLLITAPGLLDFWELFAWLNCGMAVFNMMPLPPLDGWRLVKIVIPEWASQLQLMSYQYGWVTFALLFVLARFISPFVVLLAR